MKLSLAAVSALGLLSSADAWKMRVHGENRCDGSENSYFVEGTGAFVFSPWRGQPWQGYIKECTFFWDYGNQRTNCDGFNQGWVPKAAEVITGRCYALDQNFQLSQTFDKEDVCFHRDSRRWHAFTCEF